MSLLFKFKHPALSDEALNSSIQSILESSHLTSMATVNQDGTSHINTAFFAFDDNLRLIIVTDPSTKHAKNLEKNSSVACNVYDSHQKFWTPLRGIQLFGKCSKTPLVQVPHALSAFSQRFPVFKELVSNLEDFAKKAVKIRFYTIDVERIKILDEPTFGEEVYVNLDLNK